MGHVDDVKKMNEKWYLIGRDEGRHNVIIEIKEQLPKEFNATAHAGLSNMEVYFKTLELINAILDRVEKGEGK